MMEQRGDQRHREHGEGKRGWRGEQQGQAQAPVEQFRIFKWLSLA